MTVPGASILGASATVAEEVFVLTGRVEPAAGAVPPGTKVAVLPALGREARGRVDLRQLTEPDPVVAVQPGRDGRFRLEVPGRGMWVVRVTAPGHLPVELHRMPLLDDQELPPAPLLPDVGLPVEVVDESGSTVPGARVGVLPALDGLLWQEAGAEGWRPVRRLLTTDRDGRLRLPWAAGEAGSLRAYRLGGTEGPVVTTRGEPVRLVLPPSLDRFLRLRRVGGGPLEGFGVRVGDWRWRAATTDGEGWALVAAPLEGGPFSVESPEGWRVDLELAPVERPAPEPEAGDPGLDGGDPGQALPVHLEVQVEVPLPPPEVVVGRVMSQETGEPLEGAMVWLEDRPRDPVWTDRQGRFRLEMAPGRTAARVLATAEGHHAWGSGGWPAGDQLVIFLRPARRLVGRTVDDGGEPVAGARVWLRPKGFRGSWDERPKLERTSGLDGRFDFGLRRADVKYEVRASAEGLESRVETWDPREETHRELVLRAPARAAGRVVGAEGSALEGARVQLYRDRLLEGPQQVADAELEATTDAGGRFLLSPLPADTFLLEVQRDGYAGRLLQGLEPLAGQVLDLGDVVLEPGAALAGRVVDETGEPVVAAEVVARPPRTGGSAWFVGRRGQEVRTDEEGAFRLRDLGAGIRYTVMAQSGPYRAARLEEVEAPMEGLRLVVPRGVRLHGLVVDEAGEPVSGATVDLVIEREPEGLRGRSTRSLHHTTDAEGRFDLEGLPPGSTRLRAYAEAEIAVDEIQLDTKGGEAYGPFRMVLQKGAVVTGKVLDPQGRPVPGVHVNVTPARGSVEISSHARSEADGRYRLDGAVPGSVSISVVRNGHHILDTTADLVPGPQRLDLVVEEHSLIAGRVLDPRGEPVAGAVVRGVVVWQNGTSSHMVHSEADGSFVFTGVPAGELEVYVTTPRHGPAGLGPLPFDGFLLEGLEVVMEPATTLRGRILGVDPEDLSQVAVTAHRLPSGSRKGLYSGQHTGVVRYDGTYQIPSLGPGAWQVRGELRNDGRETEAVVEITEGQRQAQLDLELAQGLTLEGRVWLNGTPLAAGRVRVLGEATQRYARTTQQGSFRIAGLEPGRYRVVAGPEGSDLAQRVVELWGDEALEFHLRAARVSGRLLWANGRPAAGVQVSWVSLDDTGMPVARSDAMLPQQGLAISDEEGVFTFTRLPEGRYRVTVESGRPDPYRTFEMEARSPTVHLGDVVLEAIPDEGSSSSPTGGDSR